MNINKEIKDFIKNSTFFQKMFNYYGVDLKDLDNVTFEIKEIDGKNGQSDSKVITLHKKLFADDFFKNNVHFLVHEMSHWLQRQKEQNFYFADPEEIFGFKLAMCYELYTGKTLLDIAKIYYPIISEHFKTEKDAIQMFFKLYDEAKKELKKYK